ncbi:MAG: LEA type 2 family protein [Oligoflexus sp.]
MLRKRLIFSVMILFLLSACAGLQKLFFEKPEAQVKEVKLSKLSLTAVELDVDVEVHNPNRFTLKLLSLNYQVQALGVVLGEGAYHGDFQVPAGESAVVTLPVRVRSASAFELGKHFLSKPSDEVVAEMSGDLKFQTPLGAWDFDFSDKQRIANPFASK